MNIRNGSLAIVLSAAVFALVSACDQRTEQKPVAPQAVAQATTAPAVHPIVAAPKPAVDPASTQPDGVIMTIDQRLVDFPLARLRVSQGDAGVTALLFSADPPAAIDNDYNGNSFYLSMPLANVKDPARLDVAQWRYKAQSSDQQEGKFGIFLQGLRIHLQPQDVLVRITRDGADVRVQIAGEFLAFDSLNRSQIGAITPVSADFTATLVESKSAGN